MFMLPGTAEYERYTIQVQFPSTNFPQKRSIHPSREPVLRQVKNTKGDWWDNCPRNISYMISISCDLIAPEIKAPKRFVII
jgi:hypothetical protein